MSILRKGIYAQRKPQDGGGIVQDGLIRHYDMQNPASYNGVGNTITDLSPEGVNGTIGLSPAWDNTGGVNSLKFGTGWVDAGSHSCTDWAIGMWIKYNGAMKSGDRRIWSSQNQVDYLFRTNSCIYSSVGGVYYPGINLSPTTEWHYILVTYRNSPRRMDFYKNNTLIASRTTNGKSITVLNFMRYRGGGYYALGYVGEMTWYDKYLSSAEVATNWDATRALYGK